MKNVKVNIYRLDKTIPIPKYETKGAVGFDLISRCNVTISPNKIEYIPSNNIIKTPPGYALFLIPRSSMPRKTGLVFPHSIGVIDQDYCGEEDELLVQVFNPTEHDIIIKKGDKIAQGVFVKVGIAEWSEVENVTNNSRGGFGSTSNKNK